ncbi:MAG TPA: proton-conducting transporter membrane subunit, partial [Actinotalea sp.]|nr:proton-conducting transporter membrane subunit [Actinotalea sp.]
GRPRGPGLPAGAGGDRRGPAAGDRPVSVVVVGLVAQLVLAALAVLAATAATGRRRNVLAGAACTALAAAGAVTGGLALAGQEGTVRLTTALPMAPLTLAPDRLSGLFILVAGAVGVLASVYAIGYTHAAAASRSQWAALAVFLLGMQLVPAAGDVVAFLLAWELMAAASTVLVLADQARSAAAREAALWYAVMTHLSLVAILAGFAVLVAQTGGTGFGVLANADPTSAAASGAFVLLVVGFAAKSGLVPLHVWLPRAHPEAPSHASALMSAAMVKMGVYGMLLVALRLLPGGPTWWAVVLIGLGAVSALYGILQASVASDVKRLLAYSTSENVGLMVLALGTALLLRGYEAPGAASTALIACLLLVVSHAAFKVTLFLGAGAVLHATGERDLDRLGGLVHRMPWTGAAFALGALGAAALPVTGGFAAEWALLQALIHGVRPGDRVVAVAVPIALAVIALTAGLALLTFVKAYGIAFLARPRTGAAAAAHESPVTMRVAMGAGAVAVVAIGVVPGPVAAVLARAAGVAGATPVALGGLELTGVGAVLDPVALTVLGLVVAVPVLVGAAVLARRHPRVADAPAWGCGAIRSSPRMQYTATSYAEPLMRIFDDALQPARDVEVTHVGESRYMAENVRYRQQLDDVVEVRAYAPLVVAANRLADRARGIQNGSIHRYLWFSFAALLLVLVVVSL